MNKLGSDSDGMQDSYAKFKGASHARTSSFIGASGTCSLQDSRVSLCFLLFDVFGCPWEWTTSPRSYSCCRHLFALSSLSPMTVLLCGSGVLGNPTSLSSISFPRTVPRTFLCIVYSTERATPMPSLNTSVYMKIDPVGGA